MKLKNGHHLYTGTLNGVLLDEPLYVKHDSETDLSHWYCISGFNCQQNYVAIGKWHEEPWKREMLLAFYHDRLQIYVQGEWQHVEKEPDFTRTKKYYRARPPCPSDTPVLVRNQKDEAWIRRFFRDFDSDKQLYAVSAKPSWTFDGVVEHYRYCKEPK